MCELNPKHQLFFRVEAFTSNPDETAADFEQEVAKRIFEAEMALNADGRYRFHVHRLDIKRMDDSNRMDWLSDHLSYAMVTMGDSVFMKSLPNRGRGWEGDELRDAIDAAIAGRDLDKEKQQEIEG